MIGLGDIVNLTLTRRGTFRAKVAGITTDIIGDDADRVLCHFDDGGCREAIWIHVTSLKPVIREAP